MLTAAGMRTVQGTGRVACKCCDLQPTAGLLDKTGHEQLLPVTVSATKEPDLGRCSKRQNGVAIEPDDCLQSGLSGVHRWGRGRGWG